MAGLRTDNFVEVELGGWNWTKEFEVRLLHHCVVDVRVPQGRLDELQNWTATTALLGSEQRFGHVMRFDEDGCSGSVRKGEDSCELLLCSQVRKLDQ